MAISSIAWPVRTTWPGWSKGDRTELTACSQRLESLAARRSCRRSLSKGDKYGMVGRSMWKIVSRGKRTLWKQPKNGTVLCLQATIKGMFGPKSRHDNCTEQWPKQAIINSRIIANWTITDWESEMSRKWTHPQKSQLVSVAIIGTVDHEDKWI